MGAADWASGWWFPVGLKFPKPELAARLVAQPNAVITNWSDPLNPDRARCVVLPGTEFYQTFSVPRLTPRFPYGYPVMDNPPG